MVDPSLAVIHAYEPGAAAYGAGIRRGKGLWYGSFAGNDRTLLGHASCTASPEVPSYTQHRSFAAQDGMIDEDHVYLVRLVAVRV